MNLYYIEYPRDFANEYSVYVVPTGEREHFEELFPRAERISRKKAVERGWTRVKEARRDGEQWFGGFGGSAGTYGTLEEALESARQETLAEMKMREFNREVAEYEV